MMNDLTVPKPVILALDDNRDVLTFLEKDLGVTYKVLTAVNVKNALLLLEEEMIDLIISDIMMPGIDGIEFCRMVKSDLKFSHIPIILLTAKDTVQSKIEGLENGADAYIEKPFSPRHLAAQAASLLRSREMMKKYFHSAPVSRFKMAAPSRMDERFLDEIQKVIENDITNPELDIDYIAQKFNLSRTTFYRKIKSISDLSPHEMISLTRLTKAAELIREGAHNINEITMIVGYSSSALFSRNFKEQFGLSPTEYKKRSG